MTDSIVDAEPCPAGTGAAANVERWVAIVIVPILVVVGFQAYRVVRSVVAGNADRAFDNGEAVLGLERTLGMDVERGVQSFVLGTRWLIDAVNIHYVWGFWPLLIAALITLFLFDRQRFLRMCLALLVSGGVGLVVYGLFPVAPPRMLDEYVDTVEVFSGPISLARPESLTNEYAAMPSFHVGWLVLAGVASWSLVPLPRLRPVLLVPGTVMTLTVMATANHYILDAIAGVALSLAGLVVADRWIVAVHEGRARS